MNQVYKIVWSEQHGTWVVCSELKKQGKKKSAKQISKLFAAIIAAGMGLAVIPTTYASSCATGLTGETIVGGGATCDMGTYRVSDNDNTKGQALVTNGDSVTLTSSNLNGQLTANSQSTYSGAAKNIFTDPSLINDLARERVISNQQGTTVTVYDPVIGSNQTINVYNNIQGQTVGDTTVSVPTGNDVYVNMRLGTANGSGSELIVSLGDQTKDPVNSVNTTSSPIPAKQTRMVQAENGGSVIWSSRNRINFGSMLVAETTTSRDFWVLSSKSVDLLGTSYSINTITDLQAFNEALKAAVGQPGFANFNETLQAAYNRRYNQAASTERVRLTKNNTGSIHPDSLKPTPERWVMAATGEGSVATLDSNAILDQRVSGGSGNFESNGGGMLAENGGKVVVAQGASLSGHYNNMTVRGVGSKGENRGVISGGYYADTGYDTRGNNPGGNSYYSEADTVITKDYATFDNYGIINVAGYTFPNYTHTNYGVIVKDNAVATNKRGGVVNVGVNSAPTSGVEGVRVNANGVFVGESGSEINIGYTAQYGNGGMTTISNSSTEIGINVAGNGVRVSHDGKITIHEQIQGATAVNVGIDSANTIVDLGQDSEIVIHGNAVGIGGAQPKQNIGIRASNSGQTQITNDGAILVLGTNAAGENIVAENGHTAKITNTVNSRIIVDEANVNLVTRNYGIYADGQGSGKAEVVADGTLTLKGDNVIGAHARGNSTMTVNSGMQTVFDNSAGAKNQIAYHINGGNAVANVAALANSVDVTTENSTLFRADDGGSINVAGLNATASGKNAVMLASNGVDTAASKTSNITVNNGTFHLSGNGSTAALVSGGASGSLKGTATVADNATGVTIGKADGRAYGLNNQLVAGSSANTQTKLVSELNTTANAAGLTGYSAQNGATVEYSGSLNLNGANSTAVQTLDGATAVLNNATVQANGNALLANGGGNTLNINGGTVTGSTNVFNSVAGNNTLTVTNGAVLNGTMTLAAGNSSVELGNGTTWNNTGNSTVTNLDNAGTVAFATPAAGNYKTITVNGNYAGNNGNLVVNTLWNSASDQDSDHLIIKGTATGTTTVSTPNGIIGNITKANAQQFSSDVVTVEAPQANAAGQQDGQPDGNAVFTGSANTTNAGQAQLVLKSTTGGKNVYAWTLYADPNAPRPGASGTYILAPAVAGYVLMPQVNQEIGYHTLGTLHERRSENQTLAWDDCGRCGEQAKGQTWTRILGSRLDSDGKERLNFETKMGGFQIGHDFAVSRNEQGGHRLTGGYLAYTRADTDFSDRYRAVNGVLSTDHYSGKGTTDAVSLGLSNTYYRANGSYLDLVGQLSWLRNKYQDRDSAAVKQNGWGAALSAEVGRPFALGNRAEHQGGWLIEPQAQLVYQYIGLKDFNDGVRQVSQDKQHSLRGRLGARLAYNGPSSKQRTNTFYAVANVWHDFIHPHGVDIGQDNVREKRSATWGEVGLGAQLPVSNSAYVYGDARYQHSFGSTDRQGYRGSIGFKYTWK